MGKVKGERDGEEGMRKKGWGRRDGGWGYGWGRGRKKDRKRER